MYDICEPNAHSTSMYLTLLYMLYLCMCASPITQTKVQSCYICSFWVVFVCVWVLISAEWVGCKWDAGVLLGVWWGGTMEHFDVCMCIKQYLCLILLFMVQILLILSCLMLVLLPLDRITPLSSWFCECSECGESQCHLHSVSRNNPPRNAWYVFDWCCDSCLLW